MVIEEKSSENKSREPDRYVHLIGQGEIKHEGGVFTLHFLDKEGTPIEGVDSLVFSKDSQSVKIFHMHLIVQVREKDFDTHMSNFNKAVPKLVALAEPEEAIAESEEAMAEPKESTKSPFAPFMTSTDPPVSNKVAQPIR